MTKRENVLLKILIFICFSAIFYFTFSYSIESINASKIEKDKYSVLLEKLENRRNSLEKTISEETETDVIKIEYSTSDIAEMILKELNRNGIIPQKYQLAESNKGEYIDTIIKCTSQQLANYFYGFKDDEYPFTIENLNIKNEKDGMTVTIRYILKPSRIKIFNENRKKYETTSLFRSLFIPEQKKEEPVEIIEIPEEKIEDGTKKFKIIGNIIENDDINYLYLKDKNTNRVYKIPENDILEDNSDEYILLIEERKMKITKGK